MIKVIQEDKLNEEKVYQVDTLTDDPVYFIGNDTPNISTKQELVNYLNRQMYSGHEVISTSADKLLKEIPYSDLYIEPVELDNIGDYKDRFLNLTHSTSRKHSIRVLDYEGKFIRTLNHHINGLEVDNSCSNIFAIPIENNPYDLIHKLLHQLNVEEVGKSYNKYFDIFTFEDDDCEPVKRTLKIEAKII